MAKDEEFTEVDGGGQDAAPAAEIQDTGPSEAKAAEAIADHWKVINEREATRQQADELEETGVTSPDNPDGTHTPEEDAAKLAADTEEAEALKEKEGDGGEGAVEKEEEGTQTPEEKAAAAARQKTLDGFDKNLIQVAVELGGWQKKDVDEFIVASPTLARVTFSNLAAGYNKLSLQYAQGVRSGPNPTQQPTQQNAANQSQVSPLDALIADPAKLKALQDVAGEELTNAFIRPLLEERKSALEDRAYVASLRRDAVNREINSAYDELADSGFKDFYGKTAERTQEQGQNAYKVGQLADQIIGGARLQGVTIGIREAIRRAHLVATADQTRAQAREDVTKQVQQRSRQITQRPTSRSARQTVSSKSDAAALAAVEAWQAEHADA